MEAKDLMIYDWVDICDDYAPCRGQVVAIFEDAIQFVYDAQDEELNVHIMEADISDVQPIPLTEKILKKNGFNRIPMDYDKEMRAEYSKAWVKINFDKSW